MIRIVWALALLTCTQVLVAESIRVEYSDETGSHVVSGNEIAPGNYLYNRSGMKTVTLSTLDWPPYIGAELCQQGWVMQLTVALLASQDYRVVVHFRPWLRAVYEVERGESDILFPEYFIESGAPSDIFPGTLRREHLQLSEAIPGGPIALLKRKDNPFRFMGNVQELIGRRVGVVRGYQNTPEFDALLDSHRILALEVKDDLQNALVLNAKRVEFIVGDPSVIYYSVSHSNLSEAQKNDVLQNIEMVEPALQTNSLYYAVSRHTENRKVLLDDINAAIVEFQQTGELQRIIKQTNQACGFRNGD